MRSHDISKILINVYYNFSQFRFGAYLIERYVYAVVLNVFARERERERERERYDGSLKSLVFHRKIPSNQFNM